LNRWYSPLAAPLVLAPLFQEGRPDLAGGVGAGVVVERLAGDLLEPHAADPRRGLLEVAVDERLAQADRLEDLRPAVALEGADAHLGHHLDDPLLDRLAVAIDGVGVVDPRLDHPLVIMSSSVSNATYGLIVPGPVAEEEGEVMDLRGVAALDDQPGAGPQALADEVVVQAAQASSEGIGASRASTPRSERMSRFEPRSIASVAISKRASRASSSPFAPSAAGEEHRQGRRLEAPPVVEPLQPGQLVVVEDRDVERDLAAALRVGHQQVALAPRAGEDRGDQLLADRVEGGLVTCAKSCLK
jgi:hypothetical protein